MTKLYSFYSIEPNCDFIKTNRKEHNWERDTFTILSAYFINHDTSNPVDPKFNTTTHVVRL